MVLVVGTRIISRKVLAAVEAPFINYHDGITPKYRGIHGGYWASARNDLANFGATVHLVDPGIDTGDVLYQVRLRPSGEDNYATFSYLQLAAALPLLVRAAEDAIAGTRDAADRRPAVAPVVAPDDLELLRDGRLPRGVVNGDRVDHTTSCHCPATGNPVTERIDLLRRCDRRVRWFLDRPVTPGDDVQVGGAYFRREIGEYSRSVGPV